MKQVHIRVEDELYEELNAYSLQSEQSMQDLSLIHIFTYRYAHLFPSKQDEMANKLDMERAEKGEMDYVS